MASDRPGDGVWQHKSGRGRIVRCLYCERIHPEDHICDDWREAL